ncbi:ribosomal protein L7/L12 [Streptomyces sp. NPDC019645]|uniref:ribosomal protein L7/L12 n=1 Tax=Streptomyces sp. NPDC019645 TaxID=3154786 RepID=UPI0033C9BF6C
MTDEHRSLLVCDDVPREVRLTDPGPQVLEVARVVRRLTGLSLWSSKALATRIPAVVLGSAPREDAEAAVAALRGAGGRAEMRERPERARVEI